MPKGQLSRVPWPGNSWMPFIFQPALRALQQPHKQSHSLQQAIHTQLSTSLHSIGFINSFFFFFCFFLSPRGFLQSTAWPHQSTARPLERASSHHQSDTPSLFIPVATMGKCKQINNSNSLYVTSSIKERN